LTWRADPGKTEAPMQVSAHFDSSEFEQDAKIPAVCYPILEAFCQLVLEPIRAIDGGPLDITSGYRPPEANAAAHGVQDSEHIWTPEQIAADFGIKPVYLNLTGMRGLFDVVRRNPAIPFHQLILEHGPTGSSIIHVSYNPAKVNARMALEGATHNDSPYSHWETAAYVSPNAHDIRDATIDL
jgi:hypothetical protein